MEGREGREERDLRVVAIVRMSVRERMMRTRKTMMMQTVMEMKVRNRQKEEEMRTPNYIKSLSLPLLPLPLSPPLPPFKINSPSPSLFLRHCR